MMPQPIEKPKILKASQMFAPRVVISWGNQQSDMWLHQDVWAVGERSLADSTVRKSIKEL